MYTHTYTYVYIYVHTHIFQVVYVPYVLSQAHACVCVSLHHMICLFIYNKTHTHNFAVWVSIHTNLFLRICSICIYASTKNNSPSRRKHTTLTHISNKTKTVYSDWFNLKVLAKSYDCFAKVRFDFAKVSWQLDIRNHHMTWVVNFYRDICAKVPRELREGEGESAFWRGGPVIKSYK
jgi:hypothetical protein